MDLPVCRGSSLHNGDSIEKTTTSSYDNRLPNHTSSLQQRYLQALNKQLGAKGKQTNSLIYVLDTGTTKDREAAGYHQ